MATNTRDPRSIITPEAFGIDDALLGIPLAAPGRRLAALVIDLVIIGILTALTSGLTVFIWGGVGLFLIWIAFHRPSAPLGQITSILFRGSAGCLGLIIVLVVVALGIANQVARSVPEVEVSNVAALEDSEEVEPGGPDAPSVARALRRVASGVGGAQAMAEVETREEARQAALGLLDDFGSWAVDLEAASGLERAEALRELILGPMADDPPYTDDPRAFADEVVEEWLARRELTPATGDTVPPETGDTAVAPAAPVPSDSALAVLREEVAGLDEARALDRYRAGLGEGRTPDTDPEMALLRQRMLAVVGGDTLATLESTLARESRARQRTEERLQALRAEVEEEGSGFVALLRDIWDQAGSAVGLWSLYFTVTLTLFQGYTLGKRALGIRVVRLDGRPITWWSAFERAGGYVAGIATGTLGFLQVYWDPNRQCVHDKIGHTAVVMAGAEPIAGAVEATWSDSLTPPGAGADTGPGERDTRPAPRPGPSGPAADG